MANEPLVVQTKILCLPPTPTNKNEKKIFKKRYTCSQQLFDCKITQTFKFNNNIEKGE